jgi:four helix bundle protein
MAFDTFSYRQLDAYQKAKEFVIYVYALLKQFPKEEQYALCDQLRRAVISIPSNIAEGMGRVSVKEQIHFIEIAFGSLNETMCQLELAYELNYISQEHLNTSEEFVKEITRMLSRLRRIRLDKLAASKMH